METVVPVKLLSDSADLMQKDFAESSFADLSSWSEVINSWFQLS